MCNLFTKCLNTKRYVLALFYLADLLSKAPISVEQDRIAILKQSQVSFFVWVYSMFQHFFIKFVETADKFRCVHQDVIMRPPIVIKFDRTFVLSCAKTMLIQVRLVGLKLPSITEKSRQNKLYKFLKQYSNTI